MDFVALVKKLISPSTFSQFPLGVAHSLAFELRFDAMRLLGGLARADL